MTGFRRNIAFDLGRLWGGKFLRREYERPEGRAGKRDIKRADELEKEFFP
jgi:hypothetical protein